LKSIIKRAVIMSDKDVLDEFIIGSIGIHSNGEPMPKGNPEPVANLTSGIREVERKIIEKALAK